MARGSIRWTAPELLEDDGLRVTKSCDIWSFACLCYEVRISKLLSRNQLSMCIVHPKILTGKIPYYEFARDAQVIRALFSGKTPSQPTPEKINDRLWDLLVMCWNLTPEKRPDTSKLQDLVGHLGIRGHRSSAARGVETSATFQLQRENSEAINYTQLEKILLRVSVKLPAPSPRKRLLVLLPIDFFFFVLRFRSCPSLVFWHPEVSQITHPRFAIATLQIAFTINTRIVHKICPFYTNFFSKPL